MGLYPSRSANRFAITHADHRSLIHSSDQILNYQKRPVIQRRVFLRSQNNGSLPISTIPKLVRKLKTGFPLSFQRRSITGVLSRRTIRRRLFLNLWLDQKKHIEDVMVLILPTSDITYFTCSMKSTTAYTATSGTKILALRDSLTKKAKWKRTHLGSHLLVAR